MQGKTGDLGEKSGRGERLAMAMRRLSASPPGSRFAADYVMLVRRRLSTAIA
jgi:hypothetical protein